MENSAAKPENPLLSILFNIALPVIILNKLSSRLGPEGPTIALLLALSLPVGYAIYDHQRRRRRSPNWLSVMGVINVLVTGSFAILQLSGHWFALKEAFFPLLIGAAVFASSWTTKPLMKSLVFDSQMLNLAVIEERIQAAQAHDQLARHLRRSTQLFSLSFLFSSLLNYVLARRIFLPISEALPVSEKTVVLNEQIAKMTSWSMVVIVVPLMVFSLLIFWHLFAGIKRLTGLEMKEILPQQ